MVGWGAAIAGLLGILAILLKDYIPGWRKNHEKKDSKQEVDDFGETLVSGTDVEFSHKLSDAFDRVRTKTGGDTSKR